MRARVSSMSGSAGRRRCWPRAGDAALLPSIGWRGMFAVGLVPALVAVIVRRRSASRQLFTARARLAASRRAHRRAAAPAGQGLADDEDQLRHVHPLLGPELRLLRADDLLPSYLSTASARSLTVGGMDGGDGARMAFGIFCSAARRPDRPPSDLLLFQAGRRSWSSSMPS